MVVMQIMVKVGCRGGLKINYDKIINIQHYPIFILRFNQTYKGY